MISTAATPATQARAAPSIIAPAANQVSFGRFIVRLPEGTRRVVIVVNGHRKASRPASGGRRALQIALPARDVMVKILAIDRAGRTHPSAAVGPVYGLPPRAAPRMTRSVTEPYLERRLTRLVRASRGTAAVYVKNLVTGKGAAWNAKARFPAASTLKLAIAIEALRSVRGPPARGSSTDSLMRSTIIYSDNAAANQLEVVFGGSTTGGSARVNSMMRSLGLVDSEMYGGYATDDPRAQSVIPIRANEQPSISAGKYTTAADLGRLLQYTYLAAGGRGPMITRFGGTFTPTEARYLLYLLVHVTDRGKLDRFLHGATTVAHKAGWITTARHDNGLVFWPGGAFVATVMTYSPGGAGVASDILAGRVARISLDRFSALNR